MARIKEFTVARGMTIGNYENDKPFYSETVELEDGDDHMAEVAACIERVNAILMELHESGGD